MEIDGKSCFSVKKTKTNDFNQQTVCGAPVCNTYTHIKAPTHTQAPVFNKEGWFPCKKDDNVKKVFPVWADGIAGHVRGEVDVRAGDDV